RVEPIEVLRVDGARLLVAKTHGPLVALQPGAASGGPPIAAIAPDDHFVLRRVIDDGLAGRPMRALDDIEVRPLSPVPGREAVLAILPLSEPSALLRPYHRAIRDVATFHRDRFLTIVRDHARVYELDAPLTTEAGLAAARERLAGLAGVGQHAVLLVLPEGDGRIL